MKRRRETINSRSKCFSSPWAAERERERSVVISKDTVYLPSLPKAEGKAAGAGWAGCGAFNNPSEIREGSSRDGYGKHELLLIATSVPNSARAS